MAVAPLHSPCGPSCFIPIVPHPPQGTYKFANPIYLNRSNVVLRGDGAATTKLIFTRSLSQIYKGSLRVDREGKVKTAWGSAGGLLMVG